MKLSRTKLVIQLLKIRILYLKNNLGNIFYAALLYGLNAFLVIFFTVYFKSIGLEAVQT